MADEADDAQRAQALDIQVALARARTHRQGAQARDKMGNVICRDCKEPIPSERLAAVPGAVRCMSCQEDFEEVAW